MAMRVVSVAAWLCLASGVASVQTPARVDFGREVQPIFRARCYSCHGPSQQLQGLRLDRRRLAMPNRVGANGARIVPGNSDASPVYRKLVGTQAGLQMPPDAPLSAEQIAAIKRWIDEGADWPDELSGEAPRSTADPHATAIIDALRRGQSSVVARLLREHPVAVNRTGEGGVTPLMSATLYGDASSVAALLDRGADPNARNDANATALMYATDDAAKTRLLLTHGADANARSDEGQTALLIAVSNPGTSQVVKLLLDHGAVGPHAGRRASSDGSGRRGRPECAHLTAGPRRREDASGPDAGRAIEMWAMRRSSDAVDRHASVDWRADDGGDLG